jgi:hypothetical protein
MNQETAMNLSSFKTQVLLAALAVLASATTLTVMVVLPLVSGAGWA